MFNISRIIILAAALAAPLSGQGRTLTVGTPTNAGMSAAVLDSGVALYREAVHRGELVGAVLLIARNGKIVLHEAIGSRQHDSGLPMEPSTMFRMASNTKPVIATAAAILVERGKLRYEDPVSKYIPSFGTGASSAITVHDLLTHTSGLRITSLFLNPPLDRPTLQLEAARFGSVGPKAAVGAEYSYSNPGYNTLGAIIEIASGKLVGRCSVEEIYDERGMEDTYHHEPAGPLGGKLWPMGAADSRRRRTPEHWIAGWRPGDKPQRPLVRAAGGLISAASD